MNPMGTGGLASHRRRAILNRIHGALDAFYLLQRVDWEYDARAILDKILALALEEIEFEGGKRIDRALIIIESAGGGALEVGAGWRSEESAHTFSRTVVHETIRGGKPVLCENAKDDPRFMAAESIKELETLSLISVPLSLGEARTGHPVIPAIGSSPGRGSAPAGSGRSAGAGATDASCGIGETIGALYIENASPGVTFSAQDVEFLREFTAAIAPYLKVAFIHQDHVREIQKLREAVGGRSGQKDMIGRSAAMTGVLELVRLAAGVDRTVLITGESGCGKELVARAIHSGSRRAGKSLVVVDCSGLSEHILESELFGHKKGSFTGASADKIGAFEDADGGTIFLDEISDAPRSLQQKLRRVLQEGEIRRVGDTQFIKVDVRVICATNRSLPDLVERGEFIRDLYFRINKFPIHIPPLRERREDIPPLVLHFIEQARKEGIAGVRPTVEAISPEAMEILVSLEWKANNVRELRNAVELACDLSGGPIIAGETVLKVLRIQRGEGIAPEGIDGAPEGPEKPRAGVLRIDGERFRKFLEEAPAGGQGKEAGEGEEAKDGPFYRAYQEFAARAIIEGLRATGWKLRPAARLLGISPMKLRGELKDFLSGTLARAGGDMARAAAELDIPFEVLSRKASDFGIEGLSGQTAGR